MDDTPVDEMPVWRPEVVVVGTLNLDHTVRVARLPRAGEGVVGETVGVGPGGKGANQAVAAARQGARAALVGCVGDDHAAAELLAALAAEPGLDLTGVRQTPGPTGRAFVTVDAAGDNTVVSVRSANAALDEEHVHRHGAAIGGAAVLLAQLGVARDAVGAALEIARSVGTMTVLDPCPADECDDELLRLVDVCTPNETEVERLTGIAVADATGDADGDAVRRAAAVLLDRGCAAVVVTLGARGAYLASVAGDDDFVPSMPVAVVDPTGAGDALCGALAAALARGETLPRALSGAVVAGALAVTRPGAVPAMPTRAEVDARRT